MAFEFRKIWLSLFPQGGATQEAIGDAGGNDASNIYDSLTMDENAGGVRCKRRGHPLFVGQNDEDCFDCYRIDIAEREWGETSDGEDDDLLIGALLCLKGLHQGESFSVRLVEDVPITIGADPDCDILLGDSQISRRHLAIVRRANRTIVRDLGSLHHSAILAEGDMQWQVLDPDREYWFRDGSRLTLGDVEMLFRSVDDQSLRVLGAAKGAPGRVKSGGAAQ